MFEWIVMFVVVETGIQPFVHLTSGRKLVISRLCTSQAGGNWLSTACAHHKRTQIGYQPFVHLTSGRKLVINRLCTPQADANWLSAVCAHLKRATTTQQNKKAPEPAQILRDFSAF